MNAPLRISEELARVLACPEDHSPLVQDDSNTTLRCVHCKKVYPIENGIPNFLKTM